MLAGAGEETPVSPPRKAEEHSPEHSSSCHQKQPKPEGEPSWIWQHGPAQRARTDFPFSATLAQCPGWAPPRWSLPSCWNGATGSCILKIKKPMEFYSASMRNSSRSLSTSCASCAFYTWNWNQDRSCW